MSEFIFLRSLPSAIQYFYLLHYFHTVKIYNISILIHNPFPRLLSLRSILTLNSCLSAPPQLFPCFHLMTRCLGFYQQCSRRWIFPILHTGINETRCLPVDNLAEISICLELHYKTTDLSLAFLIPQIAVWPLLCWAYCPSLQTEHTLLSLRHYLGRGVEQQGHGVCIRPSKESIISSLTSITVTTLWFSSLQ